MMQEKDAKGAAEEMKRILVTGFEPFGGETVNPSWEAVRALPEEIPGGRLVKAQIPVEYEKSGAELRRLLEKENPDLTILCGQAGGRKWVCVECCAINRDHAQAPDNAGEVRRYRPIAPEGPAAYFTDLPVEKWWPRLRRRAFPASRPFPRAPMCAITCIIRCSTRAGGDALFTYPIRRNRPGTPSGRTWKLPR